MSDTAHYKLVLKNGETRKVDILKELVYKTRFRGDASEYYRTRKEIEADKRVEFVDYDTAFTLSLPGIGFTINEGTMFDIYKSLRNPIHELKFYE